VWSRKEEIGVKEKDSTKRNTYFKARRAGQGPKVSKRQGQGLQEEAKPEAKKSELKIRSQSRPRRKKEGFICPKEVKALKKMKWKEFVSSSNWINGSSNWK